MWISCRCSNDAVASMSLDLSHPTIWDSTSQHESVDVFTSQSNYPAMLGCGKLSSPYPAVNGLLADLKVVGGFVPCHPHVHRKPL